MYPRLLKSLLAVSIVATTLCLPREEVSAQSYAGKEFRAKVWGSSQPCVDLNYAKYQKIKIWIGGELLSDLTLEASDGWAGSDSGRLIPESEPTTKKWIGYKYGPGWQAERIPIKVEITAWTEKDKEIYDHQVIEGTIRGYSSCPFEKKQGKCRVFVSSAGGPYNSKGHPDSDDPSAIWYLAVDVKVEKK